MFFLGASANLFIYLLIPAFVIACCYCKGIAGSPEVNTALTEVVAFKAIDRFSDKQTYLFQVENKRLPKQEHIFFIYDKSDDVIFYLEGTYPSPIYQQLYLRAPPTAYLFV